MQRRKVGRKVEGGKGEWKGGSGEERKKWWMKEGKREKEWRIAIATCLAPSHLLTSFLISFVRNREYSILFIKLFSNDS